MLTSTPLLPSPEPYLLAVLLAERYGLSVLTVDQLVWQSVLNPSCAAAHRVREHMFDTGKPAGRGAAPAAKQPTMSEILKYSPCHKTVRLQCYTLVPSGRKQPSNSEMRRSRAWP